MRLSLCVIALAVSANAAIAQDPYAADFQREKQRRYLQERTEYLDVVQNLYFSVGCKVFPNEGAILPLIYNLSQTLDKTIIDLKGQDRVREAARKGMEMASKDGCSYWENNPDVVYSLRTAAQSAYPAH